VTGVNWYEAAAYCAWDRGRLPSAVEWIRVAAGLEGREYPWGNSQPDEKRANFNMKVGNPTPVGLYPAGDTPEGVVDMAGNVWEWVEDWYEEDKVRTLHGGSFNNGSRLLRAACRDRLAPEVQNNCVGFRCAREPKTASFHLQLT
jgi:serine/threonine-protein kinase